VQDYKDMSRILEYKMRVKNQIMPNHRGYSTDFIDGMPKKQNLSFLDTYGNKLKEINM